MNDLIDEIKIKIRSSQFSPEELIKTNKVIKIGNIFIMPKRSLAGDTEGLLDFFMSLYLIYQGNQLPSLLDNLNMYTIYFQTNGDCLIGGIYDLNANKIITKVKFIDSHNTIDACKSGYIYSKNSPIFSNLMIKNK